MGDEKNKDPAYLFYSSDFLTGVIDLTMEERGQYITLMCLQHQKGHLSEKTIRLCLGSVSDDVLKKFSIDKNGNYYNERLESEIEKRRLFNESRYNNGIKGGRPRKNTKPSENHMVNSSLTYTKPSENLIEDEDEDINNNINNISIYDYIESNYNRVLSSIEITTIQEYQKIFSDDMIKYAIDLSILNQAMRINYVKAILNNWKSSQYKTLQDVKNNEIKKEIEKNKNKEPLFDYNWLDDDEEIGGN